MATKIHKRKRKNGEITALCGDRRAKIVHNWWDNVDCDRCWDARIPRFAERCEVHKCEKHALTYVGRKAMCRVHGDLSKRR